MSEQKTIDIPGDTEPYGSTRRAFHLAVVYILGAVIGLAMAIPTILYLLVPTRPRRESGWIDAGDVSQLAPGIPVALCFQESRLDGWRLLTEKKKAWVVKGRTTKLSRLDRSARTLPAPITGKWNRASSCAPAMGLTFRSTARCWKDLHRVRSTDMQRRLKTTVCKSAH